MPYASLIHTVFNESIETKKRAQEEIPSSINHGILMLVEALKNGQKVLSCGNGGSASDALHFAAELVNRFQIDRPALPAIALTADVSTLTSIGNDAHFDDIFSRQIEALGQANDILLAISTSGHSPNVLKAVSTAQHKNMHIIGLTGKEGGTLASVLDPQSDCLICVPSPVTARIQEVHLLVIHCLCEGIEKALFGDV